MIKDLLRKCPKKTETDFQNAGIPFTMVSLHPTQQKNQK